MNTFMLVIAGISLVIYLFNIALVERFWLRLMAAVVLPLLNLLLLGTTLRLDIRSYSGFFENPGNVKAVCIFFFFETAGFLFLTLRYVNDRWGQESRGAKRKWAAVLSLFPSLSVPFLFFFLQRYFIVIGSHDGYFRLSLSVNLVIAVFLLGVSQLLRALIKDRLLFLEFKLQFFLFILVMAMLLPLNRESAIGTQFYRDGLSSAAVLMLFPVVMGIGFIVSRFFHKRNVIWKL
jgi:hypothetical protein